MLGYVGCQKQQKMKAKEADEMFGFAKVRLLAVANRTREIFVPARVSSAMKAP